MPSLNCQVKENNGYKKQNKCKNCSYQPNGNNPPPAVGFTTDPGVLVDIGAL